MSRLHFQTTLCHHYYILSVKIIAPSLHLPRQLYYQLCDHRIRKIILKYNLSVNQVIDLFILSLIETIFYFLNAIIINVVKKKKLTYVIEVNSETIGLYRGVHSGHWNTPQNRYVLTSLRYTNDSRTA